MALNNFFMLFDKRDLTMHKPLRLQRYNKKLRYARISVFFSILTVKSAECQVKLAKIKL